MGSGGVAIAALPTVICLKVPFSDGLGGGQIPLAILLLACSRLIVSDLSTTRVTCINLSLTEPE